MATELQQSNHWNKAETDARYLKPAGHADDIEITDTAKGWIQKSPDGTRYRLTVANGGIPSTAVVV